MTSIMSSVSHHDGASLVPQILAYIRQEGFVVGDRLPGIRILASTLGANPNVVRDALMVAQTRGLIEIKPRSGAYLRTLDYSSFVEALADTLDTALLQKDPNLFQLIDTRILIENEAVGVAARRRLPEDMLPVRQALEDMQAHAHDRRACILHDEQFHLAIAAIAGNMVQVTILRALLILLRPYRSSWILEADLLHQSLRSHETIYNAVLQGDVDAARTIMSEHLVTSRTQILSLNNSLS